MTTVDPRDRATLSDPRVDAAWRALSDEEPPKSLDAAILAAARREVRAKPQRNATRGALAERRRWWPLAAAATVAAIVVGALQLSTPDQIGAPASDKTIVTDMPTPATSPAPEMPTTLAPPAAAKPEAGNALRAGEQAPARPTPLAKMAAGRAAEAGIDATRAKDRGPLPIAEWIALIRRLRDEGKSADAAKELAAFRVAHADHAKLLPPDLRDWRPPEK